MPINDLLAQHQLAQLNARAAGSDEERTAFTDLESYYAARIAAWRAALDLPPDGWPSTAAEAN
jgi:hypothetical protein